MQFQRLLLALVVFTPLATCAAQSDTRSARSQEEISQIARANQEQLATALSMYAKAELEPLEVHASEVSQAQETIRVTTWNIETLGGTGRGFASGFGRGNLQRRTNKQLRDIAELIDDELGSAVVAMQEISITGIENGRSTSDQLDRLTQRLGQSWKYFLPPVDSIPTGHDNMFCALMWDSDRVNALSVYAMDLPNHELAGHHVFSRLPVVGYFEAIKGNEGTNDFVVVNVHLKSGQNNEENHLIAMTMLEHGLRRSLLDNEIKESDRIILGDFNDNPYATTAAGNQRYSNAMYVHMEFKKYVDLVAEGFHSTRMDTNLTSVIDHILVNNSVQRHMPSVEAKIFLPNNGDSSTFAEWRMTFSDHFPISFDLKIENGDDDVDFEP